MGLLDKIIDATNSLGKEKNISKGLLDGVIDIFQNDGIGGFVENLTKGGLEDKIKSWIGKGDNLPVSSEQLKGVLGADKIGKLANLAGDSEDNTMNFLKDLLPGIIDKVTPNGKIEEDD